MAQACCLWLILQNYCFAIRPWFGQNQWRKTQCQVRTVKCFTAKSFIKLKMVMQEVWAEILPRVRQSLREVIIGNCVKRRGVNDVGVERRRRWRLALDYSIWGNLSETWVGSGTLNEKPIYQNNLHDLTVSRHCIPNLIIITCTTFSPSLYASVMLPDWHCLLWKQNVGQRST